MSLLCQLLIAMKKLFAFTLIVFPLFLSAQTVWQQTSGNISFTIKNMGAHVNGTFAEPLTTLIFSPDKLETSTLKGKVPVSSINTGIKKRDQHLRHRKYFDADNHPYIEIASASLAKSGDIYAGTFNVTIKGTTKQMDIPFEFSQGDSTAEFKADFTIKRRDFGVGTKGGLAIFLSDDVNVHILIKAKS